MSRRRTDDRPSFLRSRDAADDLAAELTELAQAVEGDRPRDRARRERIGRWALEVAAFGHGADDAAPAEPYGLQAVQTTQATGEDLEYRDGVETQAG